jgi:molybdopterin converting factor small subunit
VRIASPLRSYTAGAPVVEGAGATLREVLEDLDRRHPGMRFRMIDEQDRIRPHIRIFVERDEVKHLDVPVARDETVHLLCALSGG